MAKSTRCGAALAAVILSSSCSPVVTNTMAATAARNSTSNNMPLETTMVRQKVSIAVAATTLITVAAQNPGATIAVAKGTARVVKGIFSVAAGENKTESIPRRAPDSQGIYAQVAEY